MLPSAGRGPGFLGVVPLRLTSTTSLGKFDSLVLLAGGASLGARLLLLIVQLRLSRGFLVSCLPLGCPFSGPWTL